MITNSNNTASQTPIVDGLKYVASNLHYPFNAVASTIGAKNIANGITLIYNQNYKLGFSNLLEGTIRATATVAFCYMAYSLYSEAQMDHLRMKQNNANSETQVVSELAKKTLSTLNDIYDLKDKNLVTLALKNNNSSEPVTCMDLVNGLFSKIEVRDGIKTIELHGKLDSSGFNHVSRFCKHMDKTIP